MSRSVEVTPYPTVTDAQIRALLIEAAEHGDDAMRVICGIALEELDVADDDDAWEEHYGGGGYSRDERRAIMAHGDSIEAARAECARVIAEARAVRS